MTEHEYLKARIDEIQVLLNDNSISDDLRKNQNLALINYKNDLQREELSRNIYT